MFVAGTTTLRVTFDDCPSPARDLWENVTYPNTPPITLDPILFTDPVTGRTFISQLFGKASFTVSTDNDGGTASEADYTLSQGNGINSGVDHQTIGGGPFAPPLTRDPNDPSLYPNAVYYASQDAAIAQAAVSLDGGVTFGPAIPMYNLAQCTGIHGHLKVAPDGTVYVPNKSCGGRQAVVVSENNGLTWEVRQVPLSTPVSGIIDPAVGIGPDGTVYFGGNGTDGKPFTAVSRDKGRTWTNFQKHGGALGIQNATFAQMTAGDSDRAAFAFLGTTTGGNYQAVLGTPNGFKGEWHLYISTTYDRGVTWTTVNATPGDPVQRNAICNGGTVCTNTPDDRNLLDFNDIQIDNEGRVLAAIADGCISANCIQGLDLNSDGYKDNDYTARATIVRQTGGKRLLAAFDSVDEEPNPPAAPRVDSVVTLPIGSVEVRWAAPDNGGSPITGYNVYRKTGAAGIYARLGANPSTAATATSFEDATAAEGEQYFYKVTALNSEGEGVHCGDFEIGQSGPIETPCVLPGLTVLTDGTGDALDGIEAHDAQFAAVAEPFAFSDKVVFTLKVASLATVPPNTYWPIDFSAPGFATKFRVRMSTRPPGTPLAPVFEYGTDERVAH